MLKSLEFSALLWLFFKKDKTVVFPTFADFPWTKFNFIAIKGTYHHSTEQDQELHRHEAMPATSSGERYTWWFIVCAGTEERETALLSDHCFRIWVKHSSRDSIWLWISVVKKKEINQWVWVCMPGSFVQIGKRCVSFSSYLRLFFLLFLPFKKINFKMKMTFWNETFQFILKMLI